MVRCEIFQNVTNTKSFCDMSIAFGKGCYLQSQKTKKTQKKNRPC